MKNRNFDNEYFIQKKDDFVINEGKDRLFKINDNKGYNIIDIYQYNVFNDEKMRKFLPYNAYKRFKEIIKKGEKVDEILADEIAHGVKEWAISRGVTHFAHWFQPMTGLTAEKHESFLNIERDGTPINRFSGKNLIKSEPDASSFPSGGIRSTFEARGYTIWDTSSPMFIMENEKGGTLCIPSIFLSYNGDSLDKKTPLLRSMESLSKSACKILNYFNENPSRVYPVVGIEQEYFLVDKDFYYNREDLVFTGRTLFGKNPPKGQQLEDHYFGSIKERILNFMQEVEFELYKLGIPAKTRHNEVSPAQFEIAPIFEDVNIASDHNQLIMEILKKIAIRNNLIVLLHEKPFKGLNGSGKHNNWSLSDNKGNNLFDPGETPHQNLKFLLFLTSVIVAVYRYNDLLRASISTASNDYRLGGNEAPPSIISIFLGQKLSSIVECLVYSKRFDFTSKDIIDLGISKIPIISKDNTDRNRTSPFAFTGNKFEFRAVGSSQSVATPNFILNAAVSKVLEEFGQKIESKLGKKDIDFTKHIGNGNEFLIEKENIKFNETIMEIIIEGLRESKDILFEGDNYSPEWKEEAKRRKLFVVDNTPDALKAFLYPKNKDLLIKTNVLTEREIDARYNIKMERFIKSVELEAETMIHMIKTKILPVSFKYQKDLFDVIDKLQKLEDFSLILKLKEGDKSVNNKINYEIQFNYFLEYKNLVDNLLYSLEELEKEMDLLKTKENLEEKASICNSKIRNMMDNLRNIVDKLEERTEKDRWPIPTYYDLLYIN
ncbi:MAG: glutamine synthetase III [Spirochaetes bacterium]|nr:glutamine synthetase III [Spirochaetota bacterium]